MENKESAAKWCESKVINLHENLILRDLAISSAREACRYLETINYDFVAAETKSSNSDFVTEIDRDLEALIISSLRSERSSDSYLGEEGSSESGESGIRWVIDPIDGTTNFIYGIPSFGVSIAAEKGGEVIAGVVADPIQNEIFDAAKGFGARCNGSNIATRKGTNLKSSLVATGFSYSPNRRRIQGLILAELLPQIGDIRRVGSAAVDLCWLAIGRVDAFFEEGLNYWDYAAGSLIADEAGAVVINLDDFLGEELIVAVTPEIENDFLQVLEEIRCRITKDS